MKLQLIDTHTHLFSEQFNIDRADAVQRALEVGISHLLLPNIDTKSIPAIRNAIQQFDACYGMMGLHPCSVNGNYNQDLKTIEAEFENEKYLAVGEIGLDYYWDTTFKAEQLKALEIQLEWAKERGLPAIIHTRESFNDAIALVEKCQNGDLRGIFHCFGGTVDEGKRAIDAGFYLGIGGNSTFKKSTAPQVLPSLPLECIVLETDSPYLAPVPYRGKRNESAYLINIAENLATIYGKGLDEIAMITTQNALKIFNL